jgi:hypothetical protein
MEDFTLETWNQIPKLLDLHKKFLPPNIFEAYKLLMLRGATLLFKKDVIDLFLLTERVNISVQEILKFAVESGNAQSFKYIFETYAEFNFCYLDTLLENAINPRVMEILEYIAQCPRLNSDYKYQILTNACNRYCKYDAYHDCFIKILKIFLPQLENYDLGNLFYHLMGYFTMDILKLLLSGAKTVNHYEIIKSFMSNASKKRIAFNMFKRFIW